MLHLSDTFAIVSCLLGMSFSARPPDSPDELLAPVEKHGTCLVPFSDIDDTMYALHLVKMKGHINTHTDQRFPSGTEYAGVRAFYRALRGGETGDCDHKVHFLSARSEISGLAKEKLGEILDDDYNLEDAREFGDGSVSGGDFTAGAESKMTYVRSGFGLLKGLISGNVLSRDKFAEVKVKNFAGNLDSLSFSDNDVLYFNGDNGQGDLCAAQYMLKLAEQKQVRMIASIHTISDSALEHTCDDEVGQDYSVQRLVSEKKLIRWECYPELAHQLAESQYGPLIPLDAVEAVQNEATNPSTSSFGMPQCAEALAKKNAGDAKDIKAYEQIGSYCQAMFLWVGVKAT